MAAGSGSNAPAGSTPAAGSAHAHAGWSRRDGSDAGVFPVKLAALAALDALPSFAPVPSVSYQSQGRLLIIADSASRMQQALESLSEDLTTAVLWTATEPPPALEAFEIVPGQLQRLSGYLGAFELVFLPAAGGAAQLAPFDLVLDLQARPALAMHQPPQGYFHAADSAAFTRAVAELPQMVGEFEKPKFFAYKESICAHSRSKKTGCTKCIDVCSTSAISSAGDKVEIDPHLCMGCGACATVCPSGAMSYQYPRVADRGAQLKSMLNAWRLAAKGQGAAPAILFHNATDGREALQQHAESGAGLPARWLPVETWHVASIGIDVMLGAVAYGAGNVCLLCTGSEAPEYLQALQREMTQAQAILTALGYGGTHFQLVDAKQLAQLPHIAPATTVGVAAGFNLSNDKRGTLEFVVEHLLKHAAIKPAEVPLPEGSMFGAVRVDKDKCTLCLACAGACPESALMDGAEYPRLKFLERNCVQCGLCETTCPESAITLQPRLLLDESRKREVVLNESEPFNCVSCGKALGTKLMIDSMLSRLAGHSMFQGDGKLQRLQMCADCRVVDMMSNKNEVSILTGREMK